MPALTLEPQIQGAPDGPTLFFVQGWPDDASLWDDFVVTLRDRYRCVRIALPNSPGAPYRRWGFNHDEMVTALADCVRRVSSGKALTLVAHDWGAFWSYRLHMRHPELVSRMVALDIGPVVKPNPREAALIAAYQWWLIAAFALGGPLGDAMTRGFARFGKAPRQGAAIGAQLNYPYFYLWKEMLTGRSWRMSRYAPEVPCMMAYGAKKPARFHTSGWLEYLRTKPANEVLEFANQGHWLMRDPELKLRVKEFLDRTNA